MNQLDDKTILTFGPNLTPKYKFYAIFYPSYSLASGWNDQRLIKQLGPLDTVSSRSRSGVNISTISGEHGTMCNVVIAVCSGYNEWSNVS